MPSREAAPGPIVLALEGPSGAGKTTLSRTLAVQMGALLIEEAYDRLSPTPSLAFADARELLRLEKTLLHEESRRFVEAARASEKGRPVVMDTGPMGPLQYVAGLGNAGWPVHGVLLTLVREARELVQRGRLGLVDLEVFVDVAPRVAFGRSQRRPPRVEMEFIERHYAVDRVLRPLWKGPWKASLDARLAIVPGRGSVAEMAKRVRRVANGRRGTSPPTRSASRVFLRSLVRSSRPVPSGNR